MKTVFLSTQTNETTKYYADFVNLQLGETKLLFYDDAARSDAVLFSQVSEFDPDLVVYIGTRWGKQPAIATLSRMTSKWPTVHLCSDAADSPWHDLLREYHLAGAFTVQVAIDGNPKWPHSSTNLTLLTPVDPANFGAFIPHKDRPIAFGYAGNPGGGPGSKRTGMLSALLQKRILDLRIRSNLPYTYEAYCDYLTKCRISLNIAWSGTEQAMQVKGRVLETGLAGGCLLETAGSPTSLWFKPGLDYLEYRDQDEAENLVRGLAADPVETERMGAALRQKVLERHSPMAFWKAIFEKIDLHELA